MIGERDRVDPDLLALIDDAVATTAANTGLNLNICFNYGSRVEIAKAARRLAEEVAAGRLAARRRHARALRGRPRTRTAFPIRIC